ncbi:MAG: Gfo/Idh/MocA family oxidoreductase [Alphaproteobacteria bacterium]|nr:Gfo/Idh/MocA family oxidoreductase [Alphaproteobacteria bacterium]
MNKPLKAAVIGLGVGEQHAAGYRALDGVELAALCDTDATKLDAVRARQGGPAGYTDFRKMLEQEDLDLLSICSHDDSHADQAVAAFEAGLHVMVEKPIALHRSDLIRIARAHQDSGTLLSSNLILRQSPRFIDLRRRVQQGALGDLHYMEGDYLHQILWKITEGWRGKMDFYCVTYGGGIHLIDLMRWIAGEEVVEVSAMAAKKLTRGADFAYPDTMVSLLRFESDLLAKSATSFGTRRPIMHTLNVYGAKASFENAAGPARLFTGDRPEDLREIDTAYPGIEKNDLLPDFVNAIRTGGEPQVAARDVYRVMDICFACWDSVETRRTVPVANTL